MPAKSSTAAAIRPSRSRSRSTAARSGGRRCRRGPRPGRTRRSRSATAMPSAMAGAACARRSAAVNGEIFDALSGFDAADQLRIDRTLIELDGTPNKGRLGANAVLGVSLACAKAVGDRSRTAAVALCRRRLRAHPAGADDEHRQWRRPRRQPDRHPGIHDHAGRRAELSPTRSAWASEIFHALRRKLHDAGHNTNVGDEGGFAPNLASADAALSLCHAGDRERRLSSRRGCRAGARPGLDRVLPRRQISSGRRGQGAR